MILVTGGTGLVGSHLLFHLIKNDEQVRATYRVASNLNVVKKIFSYYHTNSEALFEKIEWVQADLLDIPALDVAMEGIKKVYHTAALISFDPKDYYQLKAVNVSGTSNIINLCLKHHIHKLCYVSTIGAIGKSLNGAWANEDNDWTPQYANVYALTKYRAEMEVWRGSQEGLNIVIVNPGVIIGPGFWKTGSGKLFNQVVKESRFYPPGGTGFVGVQDVIEIMHSLMESSTANQRYILVSDNLSFKTVLEKLAFCLKKKAPKKAIKFWQLKVLRLLDYLMSTISNKKRKLTKKTIHSLKNPEKYSSEKIKKELNLEYKPIEETIEFSCQKFSLEH